jgi:hypothetical protein
MRTLGGLIALAWLLGCATRPNADQGSTNTDETADSIDDAPDESYTGEADTGEADTGELGCSEEACAEACSLEIDECGPMTGFCELPDLCTCYSSEPCPGCEIDEECPWGYCDPQFFDCSYCYYVTYVDWDPALACMLNFSTVEPFLLPDLVVEIEGIEVPVYDSCDAQPAGMAWLADMQLQLCADTCAAFEDAGGLAAGFACPPD